MCLSWKDLDRSCRTKPLRCFEIYKRHYFVCSRYGLFVERGLIISTLPIRKVPRTYCTSLCANPDRQSLLLPPFPARNFIDFIFDCLWTNEGGKSRGYTERPLLPSGFVMITFKVIVRSIWWEKVEKVQDNQSIKATIRGIVVLADTRNWGHIECLRGFRNFFTRREKEVYLSFWVEKLSFNTRWCVKGVSRRVRLE